MKRKKVMVFGTFDGLHPGHLNFFEQAKRFGDQLVIVVARDENVKKIKGRFPKLEEKERLEEVREAIKRNLEQSAVSGNRLAVSSQAILGGIKDPYAIIKKIKPDVIALGYDQKSFDKNLKKRFPEIEIIRLKSYKSKIYKSSLIRN